jgi:hypothetical protein
MTVLTVYALSALRSAVTREAALAAFARSWRRE